MVRTAPGRLELTNTGNIVPVAPYELVERIRASINVLGPLLTRCGHVRLSLPGGDDFGSRPIDMHVAGLEAMGATFKFSHGYLEAFADRLHGADITFDFPSVGATENLLTAAVLAEGSRPGSTTRRANPRSPTSASSSWRWAPNITGIGTSTLVIEGVEPGALRPVRHHTVPDRIQAATYIAAVAVAGGELTIEGARPDHMAMLLERFADMGLDISCVDGSACGVVGARTGCGRSTSPRCRTRASPPTTSRSIITMLSVADGVGIVTENLYPGRFRYVEELQRLGADVRTSGHHAVVRGVPASVRCAGAGARHPCRCGDGRRRPRRRGRDA